MRRLKKKFYLGFYFVTVATLGLVRACMSAVSTDPAVSVSEGAADSAAVELADASVAEAAEAVQTVEAAQPAAALEVTETDTPEVKETPAPPRSALRRAERRHPHPILSVPSFQRAFPDVEDVHMESARFWGIRPIENRQEAEESKSGLVFSAADPFYVIDRGMKSSVPYLVPRAQELLHEIARNFMDSLSMKGLPVHKLIVTSMLRTEHDVRELRKTNFNASPQSCHRFGTTFDICYNRYRPVRRLVRDDTLKWVLSEVLRDERVAGRCWIKYEVKQGCFHITCR